MTARLPEFVIIGAIRSGTTSLARYLGAHPEVFMAKVKEVRFFNSNYERGVDWYTAHFASAGHDQICGEGTPAYMSSPKAIERMGETIPDARLIAVLRDPVARAWSHYWMRRERGQEHRGFTEAIEEEAGTISVDGPDATKAPYLVNGLYALSLRNVLRAYPLDRLQLFIFEEMIRDIPSAYENACRFLGVDETHTPSDLGRRINAYVSFRSLGLRSLMKKSPAPVARLIGRVNARTDVNYPEMTSAARQWLVSYFKEPNRDLATLIDGSIDAWDGSDPGPDAPG